MRNTAIKSAMYCLIIFVIMLLRNGISSKAAYQLYIGNEYYSDNDTSDTSPPNNLSGNGWDYEASSKTLTLRNFRYEGEGVGNIQACIYCSFPITIDCRGNNTLAQTSSNVNSNYAAIYTGNNLKITGPGTLNLTSSKHGIHCPDGDVDILNISNLHIAPAQNTSNSHGIWGNSIRIGGSYVTIDADNANQGIHAENTITINRTNEFTVTGKISALYAVSGVKNDIVGNGWTDVAGTEEKTQIPVTAVGTDRSSFKKVQFPILRNDPTVTPPSAKDLYYTGSAQELVNPGSTSGGTLYYALSTNSNEPPSEDSYSTSIPAAVKVGTYLVWYKCIGNEEYNNTAPAYVAVEIKESQTEAKTVTPEEEKNTPSDKEKTIVSETKNNKLPRISTPKLSATNKSVTVKWSKLSKKNLKKADKIEIWICTNKSFSEKDTIKKTVKKSKDSLTVKGLKSKKTYYIKMRTIKNVSGVKNVGSWTKVKKIKTDKS